FRLKLESGATGATHPERVPFGGSLERMIALLQKHQDLIAARRRSVAACGHQQIVGLLTVGNRRRVFVQGEVIAVGLDVGDAGAHFATNADFRSYRRNQALLFAELAEVAIERRYALSMANDAGDLDLVHREDHARGGALLSELLAHGGHIS